MQQSIDNHAKSDDDHPIKQDEADLIYNTVHVFHLHIF